MEQIANDYLLEEKSFCLPVRTSMNTQKEKICREDYGKIYCRGGQKSKAVCSSSEHALCFDGEEEEGFT